MKIIDRLMTPLINEKNTVELKIKHGEKFPLNLRIFDKRTRKIEFLSVKIVNKQI